LNVRVAGKDDIALLAALRREWNEEEAGGPIDDPAFELVFIVWVRRVWSTRTFFVVEVDGTPVGMGNVKQYSRMPSAGRPSDSWGYVGNVYVRESVRNAGVGAVLMDVLQEWSWSAGYDKLRLSPATRAVAFYERLGFAQSALMQLDR
jgi:GNAT superfamily N-acetyltransferase